MKSIKILIATALIMFASNALAGCTPKSASEAGIQRIAEAQEMKKTVILSLRKADDQNGLTFDLMLLNPDEKPLTSVQTWLSYNPDLLKGVSIDTSASAFGLTAPYVNDFDQEAGLLTLGRSNASPVSDKEIRVARVYFEKRHDGVVMIEAYDYRPDLEGHTSANMMVDGSPVNVLLKPQTPLFAE